MELQFYAELFDCKSYERENKSKGNQAKELLAKYGGGAYLATSFTLSLISFGLCYALIDAGVDASIAAQGGDIFKRNWGKSRNFCFGLPCTQGCFAD